MQTLNIEKRNIKDNLATVRKGGKIPAVFYGKKEKSEPIIANYADFLKVWKKAGESSIVVLKGVGDDKEALIKDVDRDPLTEDFRHVDFYVIEKGKKLEVSVPLVFTGVAPAVKELGGILVKVIHELKIEAMPKDLPHELSVDVSTLVGFDSVVVAGDIKLPPGVVLKERAEAVLASIAKPVEEKEEPATPIDLSQIEVEKKGKKDEEGEAGSEGAGTTADAGKAGAKAPAAAKTPAK